MDNPTGRVVSVLDSDEGARAIVAVEAAAACPRCAAGKGCGAGLFADGGVRQVEATICAGLDISADDVVEIALAPDNVLHAAIIVYGLPMLGAVMATAGAYAFGLGDAGAAVAALAGLGGGFAVSRWRLRQAGCLRRFVPSIERRLTSSAGLPA